MKVYQRNKRSKYKLKITCSPSQLLKIIINEKKDNFRNLLFDRIICHIIVFQNF